MEVCPLCRHAYDVGLQACLSTPALSMQRLADYISLVERMLPWVSQDVLLREKAERALAEWPAWRDHLDRLGSGNSADRAAAQKWVQGG